MEWLPEGWLSLRLLDDQPAAIGADGRHEAQPSDVRPREAPPSAGPAGPDSGTPGAAGTT